MATVMGYGSSQTEGILISVAKLEHLIEIVKVNHCFLI